MRPRLAIVALALALLPTSAAASTLPPDSGPPESDDGGLPGLPRLNTLSARDGDLSECPFDLVAAVRVGGWDTENATVSATVEVARELPPLSTIPIDELTGLDLAGGVFVDCTVDTAAGSISALLHASPNEQATNGTLLPIIQHAAGLDPSIVQAVFNRIYFTPAGELVDISDVTDAPIAVAKPIVDGAGDATLVVYADSDISVDASLPPESADFDAAAVAIALMGGDPAASVTADEFVALAAAEADLTEEVARCVYSELGTDAARLLQAGLLDVSAEDVARLQAVVSGCAAPAPSTTPQ